LRSYVGTSVLVSALTEEIRTADVQAWMARQNAADLAISPWVVTEFSAALSLKIRSGQLGLEHRAAALSAFSRITAESFHVLAVADRHYRVAARFADQAPLGGRAGDALHLPSRSGPAWALQPAIASSPRRGALWVSIPGAVRIASS
jgi:predicted nucleic acid-binding protein